jgi:hypothetical protein
LTGLAQLVAEELNCDWSKVTTEYPTPGQSVARNRIWGNFSTGGSRGIRESHEYVRKGGAAARMMLIQAAANEWKVPASECSAENSVITHKASGKSIRYGQVAAAATKLEAPKDVALKDPKDWIIVGKAVAAARHGRQDQRQEDLWHGPEDAGHAQRRDQGLPGLRRQGEELRRRSDQGHAGRQACPARRRQRRRSRGRQTWWQAKSALDALPIVWDEGEHAKVSSASIAAWLKEGLDAPTAIVGNQNGDVKAAIANAARTIEAVYSYPYQNHACMETMNATAVWTPEKCEVWTPTQNGEAALAATAEAAGLPLAKCEAYKIDLGGGFGRRGATQDWVRQVVAIAKQIPGTPIKLIWSREEDMTHGRYHPVTQCKMVGAFDKDNNLTGLHMRISGQSIVAGLFPQNDPERPRSRRVPGTEPAGAGSLDRLRRAQPADRPRDAQPACAARLLARGQSQPEHDLSGILHGRTRPCGGQGPARIPARPDEEPSQAPGRAECRRREGRLGQAVARGRLSRHLPDHGFRLLCRSRRRDLGQQGWPPQDPPHRRSHRSWPCRQPGADRAAGRRFLRLRPVGLALWRDAPSRTAASSRRISTATRS